MTAPERRPASAESLLIEKGRGRLSFTERKLIAIVHRSFRPGRVDRLMRFFQATLGQAWIYHATRRLCHLHGLQRSRILETSGSVIVVANHRSFFDMYVVTANLMRRKLAKRIIFPVRSDFFYTSWFGLGVNFLMSFFAMYPPLFRRADQVALNLISLEELGTMLRSGEMFVGLHPEGTRKKDDDPYTFLPAKPGVGRVIFEAKVPVVPVFIHGLGNNLFRQVWGNITGRGERIHVVFGAPVELGDLLADTASARLFQSISDRCMAHVAELGQEERALRAATTPKDR
jgi:1-acyl-sn-glycerol-3-phosphate acyltransferase